MGLVWRLRRHLTLLGMFVAVTFDKMDQSRRSCIATRMETLPKDLRGIIALTEMETFELVSKDT